MKDQLKRQIEEVLEQEVFAKNGRQIYKGKLLKRLRELLPDNRCIHAGGSTIVFFQGDSCPICQMQEELTRIEAKEVLGR